MGTKCVGMGRPAQSMDEARVPPAPVDATESDVTVPSMPGPSANVQIRTLRDTLRPHFGGKPLPPRTHRTPERRASDTPTALERLPSAAK